MISSDDDFEVFCDDFSRSVLVDGKKAFAIFSRGSSSERTIRGTVVSDTRSFLVGKISWAKEGSKVQVDDRHFEIEEILEKAGLYSYFLKIDYANEREDADDSEGYGF